MTTRISITNEIHSLKNQEYTIRQSRQVSKTRKKSSNSHSVRKLEKKVISNENSISDLSLSLREECLRLASFLKQESNRPGFVR